MPQCLNASDIFVLRSPVPLCQLLGAERRISVNNNTGPPKHPHNEETREEKWLSDSETERECREEKRGKGGGLRGIREGNKWWKTVLKVQAGVLLFFFCLRSSSSFCPHKTMEMQMLLISITSERTCSDYGISKERGERQGDGRCWTTNERRKKKRRKKNVVSFRYSFVKHKGWAERQSFFKAGF